MTEVKEYSGEYLFSLKMGILTTSYFSVRILSDIKLFEFGIKI